MGNAVAGASANGAPVCRGLRQTKGAPFGAPLITRLRSPRPGSVRIVHLEFDRMRRHLKTLDFGHLQLDEAVDEVVVEHAAVLEEGAVLVEVFQGLAERTADRRNRLQLFLRQI